MGSKSSLMLQDDEIKQISDETGFTAHQIEKLYSRFAHLDRANCGSLNRNDFLSIPELAINPLCDRLIQMFFFDCQPNDDERINFRQFIKILAIFRSPSSANLLTVKTINPTDKVKSQKMLKLDADHCETIPKTNSEQDKQNYNLDDISNDNVRSKLLFVFRIYDADNDGKISFIDLRSILKMMVGNYIEDVQLDKIANRAFMEVDEDKDGYIEFLEFCKVFRGKDLDDKLRVKFFN